jgi:hypothetical protein
MPSIAGATTPTRDADGGRPDAHHLGHGPLNTNLEQQQDDADLREQFQ